MAADTPSTWMIIGDSLVAGVGSTAGGWAQGFASKVSGCTVVGFPGWTSADLRVHLSDRNQDAEALRSARQLIVQVGLNDSRLRPSMARVEVTTDEYRANLECVVGLAECVVPGGTYLVGLPHVQESLTLPYKTDRYYLNALVTTYDYVIREVAERTNTTYVDVPLLDGSGMLVDGLHPSDHGHRCILYRVLAATGETKGLRPVLCEP